MRGGRQYYIYQGEEEKKQHKLIIIILIIINNNNNYESIPPITENLLFVLQGNQTIFRIQQLAQQYSNR